MTEFLSLGMLLDVVDEEWMRDTLPNEDIALPLDSAVRTEDSEETNLENQPVEADNAWRELALENV